MTVADKILAALAEGQLSSAEIASRVGITKNAAGTVCSTLYRHGKLEVSGFVEYRDEKNRIRRCRKWHLPGHTGSWRHLWDWAGLGHAQRVPEAATGRIHRIEGD